LSWTSQKPHLSAARPWFWAAAFIIATVGGGLTCTALHLGPYVTMGVMGCAMLLLIPMVRATEKAQADGGNTSPALRRYNRRTFAWVFSYMLALFAAIMIQRQFNPDGIVLAVVAILPALPILYMLWGMKRYLDEERDEYLRLRFVNAALTGTGILWRPQRSGDFWKPSMSPPMRPAGWPSRSGRWA
jgi:hypothetical protein